MKKAVFFDIDGTLWNEHMQIPKSAIEAVRTLREKGSYAFLCSGRSRANICNKELLEIGFDGVVAACGTHIEFHGKKVFEYLLSKKQVEHVLSVLKKHRMLAVLEGPQYVYVDEKDFSEDPYVIYLRKELGENQKSITGNTEFEINKLSIDLKGNRMSRLVEELGEDFDAIAHNEWLVEIVPNGFSKATGIKKVCELLGVAREDTYAFGDSANDLDMLRFVAHGIAMGNAGNEVRQAAEYVTTKVMEDGIKNGLLHYGLI